MEHNEISTRLARHPVLTQYHELTAHHRQMRGYRAHEVINTGVRRNIDRVGLRLARDRDRQTFHDEGVHVVFRINKSQPERVTFDDRYRARHELVDFLPGEHTACRKVLLQERIGRCKLFGEKRNRGDYDLPGAS